MQEKPCKHHLYNLKTNKKLCMEKLIIFLPKHQNFPTQQVSALHVPNNIKYQYWHLWLIIILLFLFKLHLYFWHVLWWSQHWKTTVLKINHHFYLFLIMDHPLQTRIAQTHQRHNKWSLPFLPKNMLNNLGTFLS